MINPRTQKEYTEIELLKIISEDVGRLSRIEYALHEDGENLTIYNRIAGIETRIFEILDASLSVRKLMIALVCISSGILLLLFLLFLKLG